MNDDDTTTSNETKSEDHEHNDKKTASLRVNLKIMLNLNHSLRIKLILQMKNLKRTHLIKKIDVHL